LKHPFRLHDLAINITVPVSHAVHKIRIHHKDEIVKAVQRRGVC